MLLTHVSLYDSEPFHTRAVWLALSGPEMVSLNSPLRLDRCESSSELQSRPNEQTLVLAVSVR